MIHRLGCSALVGGSILAVPTLAGAAEAGGGSELPKIVNFTILAAILVLALRKPLAAWLGARAQQIREQLADARADREEAARARELARSRTASLDDEVEAARRRIAESAAEEGRRIVAAAETQARKITAAAEAELQQEVRRAERRLAADAARLAARLARSRVENSLSDEDHERLLNAGIAAIRSS